MSSRTFVTADTHFGDQTALGRYGRPHDGVEEMDRALVDGINRVVGTDDLLYHLGDFVGPTPRGVSRTDHAVHVRGGINCRRIILLRGNHDPSGSPAFDALFESVHDLLSFRGWSDAGRDGRERIVMSHYGLRVWQGRGDGALHLHGHTHGMIPEIGRSTDVGVDCWRFKPRSLGEVLEMLAGRPIDMHHADGPVQPIRGD